MTDTSAGLLSGQRSANAAALERELAWFEEVLHARIGLYFGQPCPHASVEQVTPPDLANDESAYAAVVRECGMGFAERIVLMLALIPHIRPQVLDVLFMRNTNLERDFTEFGGWKGRIHGGFLPTCETVFFVLAGTDLARRFEVQSLFGPDHFFQHRGVLRLVCDAPGEPSSTAALAISAGYLQRLTMGGAAPARRTPPP